MAQENSFDVVSKLDMQEVANAIQQAKKEIETRFDFKGSKSDIELREKDSEIVLTSDDEVKLKSVKDVLETRLVKRKVHLKSLDYQKLEPATMGTVRQHVRLIQGLDSEKAKAIVKAIKETKIKVQASIQSDQVRVVGKNRDDLQKVIQLLREGDFGVPLQFVNYRG
ncbi:MAG TPA: YajQ family cyclic di-GMP-binding protein [Thermoanaerobaculia bacterium]